MTISLYDITVPVFIRNFQVLSALLDKGVAHVDGNETKLTASRLISDMQPLPYQIQRASDTAKGFVTRVGGLEPVSMADNETTIAELKERIAKTIALLEKVDRASIDGKEDTEIVMQLGKNEYRASGLKYALEFAVPNFYFHFCTAYGLLRKEGVPIGKQDYMGRFLAHGR